MCHATVSSNQNEEWEAFSSDDYPLFTPDARANSSADQAPVRGASDVRVQLRLDGGHSTAVVDASTLQSFPVSLVLQVKISTSFQRDGTEVEAVCEVGAPITIIGVMTSDGDFPAVFISTANDEIDALLHHRYVAVPHGPPTTKRMKIA